MKLIVVRPELTKEYIYFLIFDLYDAHFTLLRYCRGFTAHLNLAILMHCAGLRTDFSFLYFYFLFHHSKAILAMGRLFLCRLLSSWCVAR